MTRIEQPVEMDHKIAHMGVIDGQLRFCLPGRMGGRVVGKDADDLDLIEIPEGRSAEVGQFAADDEMKQLLRGTVWHDSLS